MLKNKIKIKINRLIIPVFSFILILIILFRFVEIKGFIEIITKIKWKWFLLALIFQFISIFFSSLLKYELIETLKEKIGLWFLIKLNTAMIFIDIIIPSQSISSFIFLFKILGKKGVEKGKRTILIANSFLINYIVTFTLLIVAILYSIELKYNIIKIFILISISLILILFLILFLIILKIEKSKKIVLIFAKPTKIFNRIIKNFNERITDLIERYYTERKKYKINYSRLIIINFFEYFFRILSLFFVILCLNYNLSIDKVIIVYLFASLIAFISYIKIGFFEAGLTLALLALGINYNLSLATTIVFRIINFWIPLILGYIATRKILKEVDS